MDIRGEGLAPDVGGPSGIEVHTAHAGFGCVRGTQETGVLRDDLG